MTKDELRAMSPEEQEQEAIKAVYKGLKHWAEEIARARYLLNVCHNIPMDEIDDKLNDFCEAGNAKYADMNADELTMSVFVDGFIANPERALRALLE